MSCIEQNRTTLFTQSECRFSEVLSCAISTNRVDVQLLVFPFRIICFHQLASYSIVYGFKPGLVLLTCGYVLVKSSDI